MSRHTKHIHTLFTKAATLGEVGNSRVAASIVMYNRIIAFGINQYKTHPLQKKFGKNNQCVHLHAEICAIKNALRFIQKSDLLNCTLYIARAKYQDETKQQFIHGLAKPCANGCERAIETLGIKKVVYTIDGHGWEML